MRFVSFCLLFPAFCLVTIACSSTSAKKQTDMKVICELWVDDSPFNWALDKNSSLYKYEKYFFLPSDKIPKEAYAEWVTLYETKDAFVFEFVARRDIKKLIEKLSYPLMYQIHFRGEWNYLCKLNIFSINAMRHALAVLGNQLVYHIDENGRIHLLKSDISVLRWLPFKVEGNKAQFIVPKELFRKYHPRFLKSPRSCMWDAIIRYGPALPTGVAALPYLPPIYSGTWEEYSTCHYLSHGFNITVHYRSEVTSF